ncbi:hypothetical protein PAMC26577_04755 [Caballeronia sordidicola]|uniref:Uncharacterized protein n=1 Tax=Caballeronia sordidicola TaxID=196367 RepID=A0A242N5P5_CABSO|nr:hypothetical protein PAMC26577_04755 [Caballeronia sordidicola]
MRANWEHSIEVNATCVHDKLVREADDMVMSTAWKEIEAKRAKWNSLAICCHGCLTSQAEYKPICPPFALPRRSTGQRNRQSARSQPFEQPCASGHVLLLDADAGTLSSSRLEGADR